MKRTLSSLVFLSLVGSTVSQAAIPVTRYDAYVVEVPQQYANQGGYWGLLLGANMAFPGNTHPRIVNNPQNINVNGLELPGMSLEFKPGPFAGLTAGYRIYSWRFEAELDYRYNKWKRVKRAFVVEDTGGDPIITEIPDILKQGGTSVGTILGNVIYDYYCPSGWMWSWGLGLGYSVAYYNGNLKDIENPLNGSVIGLDFSGTKGSFAGQFIFGIAYRWGPCLETGITYHLFARQGASYNSRGTFANNWTVEFTPKYVANTINLEFRFF